MNAFIKNRLVRELGLTALAGSLGFLVNGFPLKIFPSVLLLFGSSVVITLAVRRGPASGLGAGLVAGARTLWIWHQPFPLAMATLAGEGIWVGYFCRRRGWRPLYATLTYWLLLGSWLQLSVQYYFFNKLFLNAALISFRSILNGLLNALLAEVLLILLAYLQYRRNPEKESFRLSLSATVGLMLVLAIGLTAVFGVAAAARNERAKAYENAELAGKAIASSSRRGISGQVAATFRSIGLLSSTIRTEKLSLGDTERLNRLLDLLRSDQPELSGLYIADADARAVACSLEENAGRLAFIGANFSDRPYYRQLLEAKKPVFSSLFKDPEGKVLRTATVAVPITGDDGVLEGFIAAWYKPSLIQSLAERLASENSPAVISIVDQQGQVIVDSASREVANELANVHSTPNSSLAKLALPGGEGSSLIGVETPFTQITIGSAQEKNYLSCTNWSTVPSLGWKVIVSKPMFPVEVELARHNLEMIEELLGLMLLAIIISNAIGNRLTRPLIELESYALKLASGDLATRPATAFVVTQEAHSLRSAFSRMAIALEESWKEQKAVTKSAEVAAIEAQERARHVAALNKLGQELSLTFDLKSICRAAHRYIETQVSASGFVISLFDEREQLIKSAFVWGDGRELDPTLFPYVPLGDGSHSRCIRAKSPVLVEDIIPAKTYKNVHFIGTDEDPRKPQSVLYLPLISFDRVVGTLQVQGYERAQFRPEDIERLMAVASQIAVSINNAMLFEQIEDAKREWEKTFDSMSDGVFLFGDSGILIRVNRAGADMEGADIKELVGKRCCDILAHTEKAECFVGPAIRNGSRVVKEIVILRGARTLLVTIEPVLAEGRVGASICVARDITELRRAEEEVRQQREFAAQLVESAQESIFTFDLDGRVTWFNRRFCETTGYSERDAAGINVRMLVHRDDLQATAESVAHVLDGANETCEARFVRKSGEARWFKTTLTPIKVSGSVTSILAVTRDVTDERLALEQLQRANKLAAVGQLAAGVAHDFNNLLVPILGRAQLLKRQLTDERARRGLEIIEKAALDGAATVRRLQNFSRQRAEDRMEPVGVADLLRDVVELTRTRWRDDALARGVKYEINLSFGEGNVVMGSPSELREVFTNIVINALDAMPEGGRLSIKSQAEGAILHISISDTGLGMSADVRQHIFEPFFTTKGHAGNGLGLAVSYGIIKRHSGSIQVDSAPGLGTTFKITLPLTGRKAAVAHPEIPQADLKARVMVVDDEELVRTTLVDILTNMGLEVVSATGGGQGLTLLSTWPVDLVLTDLSMPEMDGWTFARRIREQFPDIKTVLVTGYGSSVELEEESAGLVDAVVGKPYDYSEIAQVVQRLTGRTAAFEAV